MLHWLLFLLALLPFYLIGAFPTGKLIAAAQGIDISRLGSGNVGATNIGRVMGRKAGILTLLGDTAKGALGYLLASALSEDPIFQSTAAFFLVAGHCFSIPGKLKGGKGVATALGVALTAQYPVALLGILVFAATFWAFRIVSAASISAALSAPIVSMLLQAPDQISAALAGIALLVCLRHQENILRLIEGREAKFSFASEIYKTI